MRVINKRRLLEYLIYGEIKEIQYLLSFDFEGNGLEEGYKKDLIEDLNEVSEILKSLSYTHDEEEIRTKFENWYRNTYGKKLILDDLIPKDDLSRINN